MKHEALQEYKNEVTRYKLGVDLLRRSRYIDYPREVSIETQAVCNAACSFCPYPGLERKGTKMPDELIAKIIAELGEIPSELPFTISPFKVNDPLLDSRIFDIVGEINAKLPNVSIRMFTNGSPLSAKNIAKMAAAKRVEHLWVSLNEHEKAPYEKLMAISFDRTISNLDMLHKEMEVGNFPHKVVVSRVRDHSGKDEAFLNFVHGRYPRFGLGLIYKSAWLGQVTGLENVRLPPLIGCARWWELSITCTGKVSFCCMDGKAEHPIGDVTEASVLEIYNSPAYRRYREKFVTRLEGSPCLSCTHF